MASAGVETKGHGLESCPNAPTAAGSAGEPVRLKSKASKINAFLSFKTDPLRHIIADGNICHPNESIQPNKKKNRIPTAASVPLNEPRPPLPDWSWRGRAWPIYFREARGSREAARCGWPAGLAGSAHSWGWAVSEASCLSGLGYGYNESRLGDGDGVAAGGGAKPSPASGVRKEHQLY